MSSRKIMTMLETNENNNKFLQRNSRYKKESNGNFRTEKYNNQNKNFKNSIKMTK